MYPTVAQMLCTFLVGFERRLTAANMWMQHVSRPGLGSGTVAGSGNAGFNFETKRMPAGVHVFRRRDGASM